jgi:cellobiose phosphorylase
MHTALLEYIFGLKPEYEGLRIDPCVDPAWTDFSVTRKFRGAIYQIDFRNPHAVEYGVKSITMDGKPVQGNLLPVMSDGKLHTVEVLMGA